MRVLNLFQDLLASSLKIFVGVGAKVKPLVRNDNSPQLIFDKRGCVLCFCCVRKCMLSWFSGKRTFIDGSVYLRFNVGLIGCRIIFSEFMWFCVSLRTPNICSCSRRI